MSLIPGKYQHYKNDNIDDYFTAVGVPYIGRKIISLSSPLMEITREADTWSIKTSTYLYALESKFRLDKEYEEKMPTKNLKSKTISPNNSELETVSISPNGLKYKRHFLFSVDECIMTLMHEKSNQIGKRYFRRVE